MTRRSASLVLAVASALISFAAAEEQPAITKTSPFLPPAAASVSAATAEQHEFRAVSTLGDKTTVNIHDLATKKRTWIAVGETAEGISVLNYDSNRDQVVVRIGGVEKTLTLRQAIITSGGPAAAPGALPVRSVTGASSASPANPPIPAVGTVTVGGGSLLVQGAPGTASSTSGAPPVNVAQKQQESRMLVSDLLEIGVAQRRAHEEAQKKQAQETGAVPAPAPSTPAR